MNMTTQYLIVEARSQCQHLVGNDGWNDAVEDKIVEIAESEEQAEEAIIQLNMQTMRSSGII